MIIVLIVILLIIILLIEKFIKLDTFISNDIDKNIPNTIHKIFIDDTMEIIEQTEELSNAIKSWKILNPEYTLKIYSGNDCIKYLKENFTQDHLDCFETLKPYSYKTDFMRYCILYNEGGWYTDWQQILLVPLDVINDKNYEWVSCWDTTGGDGKKYKCMQNGFFGCSINNSILKNIINKCIENTKNFYYGKTPWHPTGPCLLGEIFREQNNINVNIGYTFNDSNDGPCFNINNKKVIINKCCVSRNVPGSLFNKGNNYMELWKNKKMYNNKMYNKKMYNFVENTCVLLTMTVNIRTINNKNTPSNSSENRLIMYNNVINDYLQKTNLDIYIIESSGYSFNYFDNNPRIRICSFISDNHIYCKKCEATPFEAESILYALKYFNLKDTFKNIIKITGRYYIPNLDNLIMDIPEDADIFFQYTKKYNQQSSEIFGCKTIHLENIMNDIIKNSKNNMNFEKSIFKLNNSNYKNYRFPKIILETPIRRGGDNKLIHYL